PTFPLNVFIIITSFSVTKSQSGHCGIKSVTAQQNVTLTCPRTLGHKELMYWIRIISGHQSEFLGGTYGFDYSPVHQTRHFTTKQELGTFILHIHQTQISDTGLYYCIQTETLEMTFVRGVFLKVKGPKSSISGIVQAPPSAAVHPGESVSLQCSVLSDSEKKTCSEDYRVHWFRAGSHQSHPSFIYTHGDKAECQKSSQKCFYSFSKKVSVSDAGTYYCAVAACGEVMFGNGAKLDIKAKNSRVIITFVPVFSQTDEASLIYSAPTFSRKKVTKEERGNTHSAQKQTIYSDFLFHHGVKIDGITKKKKRKKKKEGKRFSQELVNIVPLIVN
uniref:Ig-like domain-containing protein n=1 Tax=Salarias fasciatus TaxID=181472 RepID=A0A672INB9_SALFA